MFSKYNHEKHKERDREHRRQKRKAFERAKEKRRREEEKRERSMEDDYVVETVVRLTNNRKQWRVLIVRVFILRRALQCESKKLCVIDEYSMADSPRLY